MKRIFFIFSISVLLFACSENNKKSNSDNNHNDGNTILVSSEGIGEVKIDMTHEDLEKLLNQKIPLSNPTDTSGSWQDSAKIKYRDIDMDLVFQRNYFKPDTFRMEVIGIKTFNPLCKTKSGIGIGTEQAKILDEYEDSYVLITPGHYIYYETLVKKGEKTIMVRDDSIQHEIRFFMTNKKVVGFEVAQHFSDSE